MTNVVDMDHYWICAWCWRQSAVGLLGDQMKWPMLALLAFAPILIDEATYNQILSAAHANMRGTEYDWFSAMFKLLEQRATEEQQTKLHPAPEPNGQ
jgi:hypothetical protein